MHYLLGVTLTPWMRWIILHPMSWLLLTSLWRIQAEKAPHYLTKKLYLSNTFQNAKRQYISLNNADIKKMAKNTFTIRQCLQLDCRSATRTRKINLPANHKGYDTFETTVGKLSAGRIQICRVHFCLGIILNVILINFKNKRSKLITENKTRKIWILLAESFSSVVSELS